MLHATECRLWTKTTKCVTQQTVQNPVHFIRCCGSHILLTMPLIGWKVSHYHMHNTYHSAELLQILVGKFRTVKQNSPNQANPGPRSGFHPDYDTTHLVTGASLSLGHVFETVFRPTCATRTLHMAVSDLNSKRFVLMLLPGRNETFVNCAI